MIQFLTGNYNGKFQVYGQYPGNQQVQHANDKNTGLDELATTTICNQFGGNNQEAIGKSK